LVVAMTDSESKSEEEMSSEIAVDPELFSSLPREMKLLIFSFLEPRGMLFERTIKRRRIGALHF
jgi:hypothetical protein